MLNFVGPKYFPVGISLVSDFFPSVFCGSNLFFCGYVVGPRFFSHGYFVGPRSFLVGVSWVHKFFLWVISQFSVVSRMRKSGTEVYLKLYSKSISTMVNSTYIRRALHLPNYLSYYTGLVCTSCIFSHLFSLVTEIYSYCKKNAIL